MADVAGAPAKGASSSANGSDKSGSSQIAHTLTACCRCRARKTRCDPGLPRCGPCERNNAHCEYFDQTKGRRIPRNYVVHLQHTIRDLEAKLADLDKEEGEQDPEDALRGGATVRIHEHDESKFLGPSSGIAITRLVMQLAKQFTDSKSISDIVPENRAQYIKEKFTEEEDKPTSKNYPLISDVAAEDLPPRDLANRLVTLFNCKVLAMYPFFHEPTLLQDVEDTYNGSTDPFQNFATRMVLAVSLQRMEAQYAGLADSYYLAALQYLEGSVKPMNVQTIQCFCLIAAYSLLTPTRTAVYYVVGLAGRLAQALGLYEEKTIVQGARGGNANPLEIDMRRRVFWCIMTMEYGLAHSLGRPSCFTQAENHIDVAFYQTVDDEFITKDGIAPNAPPSLKKWISIHFFKMRLLQLEIRRKLYQKKRAEPKDDKDPWFKYMEEKLERWRDTSPDMDAGSGLNKVWFIGRYNTMIVFLFRPSPQVPRPSLRAAIQCYDACKFNVYMHQAQIDNRSVELTWIFTQSIFMAINSILWTLSYQEIRRAHPREEVKKHLEVALECIAKAIQRWPGVASARELYQNLIDACLKIYDKDGDIPLTAESPADSSMDGSGRSRTTSPTVPQRHVNSFSHKKSETPPTDRKTSNNKSMPSFSSSPGTTFQQSFTSSPGGFTHAAPQPTSSSPFGTTSPLTFDSSTLTTGQSSNRKPTERSSTSSYGGMHAMSFDANFDPNTGFNPLPTTFNDFTINWNPNFNLSQGTSPMSMPATSPFEQAYPDFNQMAVAQSTPVQYSDYLYPPSWNVDREMAGTGLSQQQQMELMQSLQTDGQNQINQMIQASNAVFYPHGRGF